MITMLSRIINHITQWKLYTIGFVGDSISSCEWIHPNWTEILEYVLKRECENAMGDWQAPSRNIRAINLARDGSTTQDWVDNMGKRKLGEWCDLVFVMGSCNDRLFGIPQSQTIKNLQYLIKNLQEQGKTVVYCTTVLGLDKKRIAEFMPYIQVIRQNVVADEFVDMWWAMEALEQMELNTMFTLLNPNGAIDPEHPNKLWNAFIAKIILKQVFNIQFDYEKYIEDSQMMNCKYPGY